MSNPPHGPAKKPAQPGQANLTQNTEASKQAGPPTRQPSVVADYDRRSTWQFDEDDSLTECFQEDLLRLWPEVEPALERVLNEIRANPKHPQRCVVEGQIVYTKLFTAATANGGAAAFLLGYILNTRTKRIRRVLLCHDTDLAPQGSETSDHEIYEELHRLVSNALGRAMRRRHH
jgi:hypothetical protein